MKKLYLLLIALSLVTGVAAQSHFQPAFDGNGYDHMNIYLVEATIEGSAMQAGDEIAVFDGDICAGVFVLSEALIDSTIGFINASKADQDTSGAYLSNGYTPGNELRFKLWDASEGTEYDNVDITFIDPDSGQETPPVPFTVGASVFVGLNAFTPCELSISDTIYFAGWQEEFSWVNIITTSDWSVISSPNWAYLNPASHSTGLNVPIFVETNPGDSRIGEIVIEGCDGITKSITVNQQGAPCHLNVSDSLFAVDSTGDTRYLVIDTYKPWSISSTPEWISFSHTSGIGHDTVNVSIDPNAGTDRNGSFEVVGCDGLTASVEVVQDGPVPCLVSLSKTLWNQPSEEHSRDVRVYCNSTWELTAYPDWITPERMTGADTSLLGLALSSNIGVPRSGEVVFETCDGVTATLVVNQDGLEPCLVSFAESLIDTSFPAVIIEVGLICNSDWQIVEYPEWLSVNQLAGTGDTTLLVELTENSSISRSGDLVVITCEDVQASLTINQRGSEPCLVSLSKTLWNQPSEEHSRDVRVYCNSTWELTAYPDWITPERMTGADTSLLGLALSSNIGVPRSGEVVFETCDGVTATLVVNQDGPLKSAQITPNISVKKEWEISKIYPNPFSEELRIEINKEKGENILFVIYDMQGRIIQRKSNVLTEGLNTFDWDATDANGNKIQPGLYILQLQSNLRRETFKVVYQGE
ncbi:BACON domain-containing carbohydrate-binding protein [uncultured Draconibacterium sp.]|uniref:BACON domain-containing protein n=1 Tax=uncultured Draconibacterium sp. TaxID=1573823 RepID=UPI0025E97D42|nr:BACON domain-containing carbohydrate-binding protein [uncultured Draconibacterium sp.]